MKSFVFSIVLVGVMLCFDSKASGQTSSDRNENLTLIDQFYDEFIENMNFRNDASMKTMFLSFFDDQAQIDDNWNLPYMQGQLADPFKVTTVSPNQFVFNTSAQLRFGSMQVITSALEFSENDEASFSIILVRKLTGFHIPSEYNFLIQDTIKIDAQIIDNSVKISKIALEGMKYEITNDRDGDFVSDTKDKCPDVTGDFKHKGCPPPDGPALFVSGAIQFGISSNSISGMDLNSLASSYNACDLQKSSFGGISNTGISGVFSLGGSIDFYPWRKRIIGFSAGLQYTGLSQRIVLDAFSLNYVSDDTYGQYYRTMSTNSQNGNNAGLSEKLSIGIIDLPLLLKFKSNLYAKKAKKFYMALNTGPVLRSVISSSSRASGDFDFEGEYHFTSGSIYSTASYQGEFYNYKISRVSSNDPSISASDRNRNFDQAFQNGMDVGLNQKFQNSSDFKLQNSWSFLINPLVYKKWSQDKFLFFGFAAVFSNFEIARDINYRIDDNIRSLGSNYKSLVNGNSQFLMRNFTLQIGMLKAININ